MWAIKTRNILVVSLSFPLLPPYGSVSVSQEMTNFSVFLELHYSAFSCSFFVPSKNTSDGTCALLIFQWKCSRYKLSRAKAMLALERGTLCLTLFLISHFFLTTGSGNPHCSRLPKRTTLLPLGNFSLMEHVISIREVTGITWEKWFSVQGKSFLQWVSCKFAKTFASADSDDDLNLCQQLCNKASFLTCCAH